jgi:hypothetical protein
MSMFLIGSKGATRAMNRKKLVRCFSELPRLSCLLISELRLYVQCPILDTYVKAVALLPVLIPNVFYLRGIYVLILLAEAGPM